MTDHLGTPQELYDEQREVVWAADLSAYGRTNRRLAHAVDNPIRFPGQYYDEESGLHYNRFRYYEPQTGRCLTKDPIGLGGGINELIYVEVNPINGTDQLGLFQMCYRSLHMPLPYARHCYARFSDGTTSSFDPSGVHPDPAPNRSGTLCTTQRNNEKDDCIKRAMQQCEGENYSFTKFNCCHCVEQAMKECGVSIPRSAWPNYPINPGSQPSEAGYTPYPIYDSGLGGK